MNFRNVTLELSLKPFWDPSPAGMEAVARHLFTQWAAMLKGAEQVSVMMWTSDGSEILDYRGSLDDTFEWAKWVGVANPHYPPIDPNNPEADSFHRKPRLYRPDPPEYTYGMLKQLVATLKRVGRQVTGLPVRIGATFDPGPEFAVSTFKYKRHPEICMGNTMGKGSMVCCYADLHADSEVYAGYPNGIPEGTPFGEFLGRQTTAFVQDLGFDYLWLSNGFGFGLETWGLRGALFDGKEFSADRCEEVRQKSMVFWESFRRECPDLLLETRGTNLATGMDLSSDAVPLREIYDSVPGVRPPPNSPWAALNGDFGLELAGWMSHVAEIPEDRFPFRFYTHDPWFLNSPWLDRYQREAHDIFLPLTVSRLGSDGAVQIPTDLNFLTADDSHGELPDQVPNEVTPHILWMRDHAPDQPGPLVWVYPFDEYHDWTFGTPTRIEEVFFGDWFMRGAINQGLPLNTVVSTGNLASTMARHPERLGESILVSPVPDADTAWEQALYAHWERGGRVLLYGPLDHASPKLAEALGCKLAEPLDGDFELAVTGCADTIETNAYGTVLRHTALFSAGGLRVASADQPLATACRDGVERVVAVTGERVAWVRGTVACDPNHTSGHLLIPLDPGAFFPAEMLMRIALQSLGVELAVEKIQANVKTPMVCACRHDNGFVFTGYSADTTSAIQLRLPQGAPVLDNTEMRLVNGRARYTPPKSWAAECRVFVEQADGGPIGARTRHSGHPKVHERLEVNGLKEATVRFYPKAGTAQNVVMSLNMGVPCLGAPTVEWIEKRDAMGHYLEATNVSGLLMISW
jgi:hypothetical protein